MAVEIVDLVVGIDAAEVAVVVGFRVDEILLVVNIEEEFVDVNIWAIVVGTFVARIVDENGTAGVIVVETVR